MEIPSEPIARASQLILSDPGTVFDAFVLPDRLTQYGLSAASGPLAPEVPVLWRFMVPGAEVTTTAKVLERGHRIVWQWGDALTVEIGFGSILDGTAVSVSATGFAGSYSEKIDAAVDATEGFAIVLNDLKTLLESGRSAGLTTAKARLIAARMKPSSNA